MPKIVDHSERKLEIAEATWRVVKQKGIKGVSVRNIAQESGLSPGALRHYFPDQEQLLVFVMQVVKDRVSARIQQVYQMELPPVRKVLSILLEMVPTDEERRTEMEVWFEFTFHMKKTNPDAFDSQHDGIYQGMVRLLAYLEREGKMRESLDLDLEAERLYAVLDGLALHMLLDRARLDSRRARQVLEQHLASICR
ncbi:TetR/AcrR family transcriptional regulator [Paenibacillus mesotrionivorans]|uniref:TetR/AcrR family transcriptional regulator n=1 Tax=Paenibacillus mesotrionivorans TaxID=3160968 RepID=A0ACC7P6M6_9BACL